MSFQATSGKFVVNDKELWVYDVDIYLEDSIEKKAVVGFSPKQFKGALFWQCDIEEVMKEKYDTEVILKIAREYRDLYRLKAICE